MAESSLSITYNTLRREVGTFMGWGKNRDVNTWTTENNTDFADILSRGLRLFYFPPTQDGSPYYEWSFLRDSGTITLATGDSDYDLADNFSGTLVDNSVTFASGKGYRSLQVIEESAIRKLQAMAAKTDIPRYYAVRTKAAAPTTGQRWEMTLYPAPSATVNGQTLTYRYATIPNTLSTTDIYPAGGAQHSEVVLAAVLAAAEYKQDDDPGGPQFQRFMSMLPASIRLDEQTKKQTGAQ